MLCGTLPYDDDPNNVNGENLVTLYKYIMETTLKFPVPISKDARHLVCRILNTDPKLRANISEIKSHS
jgi:protein-serine/threonine kinase